MKAKCCIFFFVVFFSSPVLAEEGKVSESTAAEQVDLKVTVYNNNLGLIKDTRKVKLPHGESILRFMDVASHVITASVHVKSLNYPDKFTVIEQNYEYDLMDKSKLLDKYVGKKIKLLKFNDYQDRKEVVEAILLSNNQGPIYKINDKIYLDYPGYQILPEIPEDLIATPTLTWLFKNTGHEPHNLEVSYLTNNISWKADYVVVLNKKDTKADISSWVTLDNQSGATYRNASLKLVAGVVHRVREDRRVLYKRRMDMALSEMAASPRFEEKGFAEYHIYDLNRKTTIKDKQTKQVSLFEAFGVGTDKEYIVYGDKQYFTRHDLQRKPKQPVNVYLKFKNSQDNNLGMPLPAGIMRLYKEDDDKSMQFIGEDKVAHTPKDEEVKLKVGEAFDLVAERVQTGFKRLTSKLYETEWEITLKNRKDEDVTIGISEKLSGFTNWEMLSNSHPYKKVDAFTVRFDIEVPKDKEIKVKYRVRVGL